MGHSKYWIGYEVDVWVLRASDGSLIERFSSDEEALCRALKIVDETGQTVSSIIHSLDKKLISIFCAPQKSVGINSLAQRKGM